MRYRNILPFLSLFKTTGNKSTIVLYKKSLIKLEKIVPLWFYQLLSFSDVQNTRQTASI